MKRHLLAWPLATGLVVACAANHRSSAVAAAAAHPAPSTCASLEGRQIAAGDIGLPTSGATIASVVIVPASAQTVTAQGTGVVLAIPEYCRVIGAIAPVDPAAPKINFQVNLPSEWNGKIMQLGGSGTNGVIRPESHRRRPPFSAAWRQARDEGAEVTNMRRVLISTLVVPIGMRGEDTAARWWSHVEALANDGMEGRNTGSAAHKRAAEYVAAQFKQSGLEPAGTSGYIQPVAFKTRTIDEAKSSLALVKDDMTEPLALGEDANISVRVDPASSVDAPLVFVGRGLNIPERNINDFAGVNLQGAVVVYISATPRSLPGPLQAHFGSAAERWKMYKAAGAIGTVSIANPRSMDIPWARSTLARLQPAMSLVDEALDETAGQQLAVTMNPAHADKLFAGSGHTFAELLALVDNDKAVPSFALPARLKAVATVDRSTVESQNVAGILRGSDPVRRDEFVVLSAHLDHLGIGGAVNGDTIYNGAMDNAAGVAAILEVAASLHRGGAKPARSILFVAVTGEEKGELGSRYFAAHPTVPRRSIVANVNIDMFLPLFPLKMLMVLGLDESDLGGDIRATAKALGVAVQADPEPQRNRFVRSDQYSFVRAGIPALAMKVGYDANTPEAAIAAKWTAERYHAPSDDLNQPIDRPAAGKYVEVMSDLAVRIANRTGRPKWNDTSFFKRFANPAPAARAQRKEQLSSGHQ